MVEHWKSTGRYWCKHCKVYVRDTNIERTKHEASGKHKGALRRFLRDVVSTQKQKEKDSNQPQRDQGRLATPGPGVQGSAIGKNSTNPPVRFPAPQAVPISSYGSAGAQTSTSTSTSSKIKKSRESTVSKKT